MSSGSALVERFDAARILIVGDLVADHYLYGQTDRVSREAPVLVVRYEDSEVKLGGGANVAANARSLGARVTAVGVLGNDQMGGALREAFEDAEITLRGVEGPGLVTEAKTRVLAGGLNTTRQQMIRLDSGNRGPFPEEVQTALAEAIREAAANADVLVVSDYGAGVLNPKSLETIRQLASEGLCVCADSRYGLRRLSGVRMCKPNEPELESLIGQRVDSEEALLEAGRMARAQLECESLLVTRGRSGMALFRADGVELLPVHGMTEAVDVTGAGDTVLAAFSLALAAGGDALEAAKIANVAGALAVGKAGTATVSREELVSELLES